MLKPVYPRSIRGNPKLVLRGGQVQHHGEVIPGSEVAGSVLDALREGLQVLDREYRYVYVNEAVTRHGRATRDGLLGRRMQDVYPGIEHTRMFQVLTSCMQLRRSTVMENEFEFEDGSTGWFELRFEPVAEGLAVLSVDISERKRTEQALGQTLRTLATLSQCNQTLVRATDGDRLMNDVCALLIDPGGYRAAWISFLDTGETDGLRRMALRVQPGDECLVAAADSEWARKASMRVMRDEQSYEMPFPSHLAQGEAACMVWPIHAQKHVVGCLTVVSARPSFTPAEHALLSEVALDLGYGVHTLTLRFSQGTTARKLEESRARARAIYDHLPSPLLVWKCHGDQFVLVDSNHAAQRFVDRLEELPAEEALQLAAQRFPDLRQDLAICSDERRVVRREIECTSLEGDSVAMVLSYGFIPPDMVALHAHDVSELREAQQKFVAAQRLEAIGQLSSGIAHDFNNMLSIILMYAQLGGMAIEEDHPLRGDLRQIEQAGVRAASLTSQLLTFSRREQVELEVVDLHEVIDGILPMVRRLLGESIVVNAEWTPRPAYTLVAVAHVEQIVMNLAVNARDAMPDGGTLALSTTFVEDGQWVRLSVSDTGTGMSPEVQSRLFEPFFTTKVEGKGTGLGLATVHGIVTQHGGRIGVESELGRGTIFRIDFAACAGIRARSVAPREQVAGGNETVLVVDDDAAAREGAARILREVGYQVHTAANAGEAWMIAEELRSDLHLIVCDLGLPRMDGVTLAQRLRTAHPALRMLLVAGHAGVELPRSLRPGIDCSVVIKPLTRATLTRHVRRALDDASVG